MPVLRLELGSENLAAKLDELEADGNEIVSQVNAGDGIVVTYRKRQGRPRKGANEPQETR